MIGGRRATRGGGAAAESGEGAGCELERNDDMGVDGGRSGGIISSAVR